MRFGWLLLLSLFAFPAAAQSDPYQWVGFTPVAFTGDGNGLGFIGMTTQCRADFGAGSRMCTSEEFLLSDTLNPNAIPTAGAWIRPSWNPHSSEGLFGTDVVGLDETGVYGDASKHLTCRGWTTKSSGNSGLVVANQPGITIGGFENGQCTEARPVACCKPTPVPAPTSSLSLPIGAGALAGLSMVKKAS
jgi:hypothetical protein